MREPPVFDTITQMLTRPAARDALPGLVRAAREGNLTERGVGASWLATLSGREWLQLDDVARGPSYLPGGVAGTKGWLGPSCREPSGFAAVIASMHVDGRIRERATLLLTEHPGPLRSAALALRCLDHVAQVRTAALVAIATRTLPEDAEAILGVLTAASERQPGPTALAEYSDRLLNGPAASATLTALRSSADRNVRRWAFQTALDRGLLSGDDILLTAMGDADQVVRARCYTWLGSAGTPAQLAALLQARPADGRVVALQHLAEQDLSERQLRDCLLDRSARVREMAQWRARRRDLELGQLYRSALANDPSSAAAALAGLAAFGTGADVSLLEPYLLDVRPAVRAAAIAAVAARVPPADARQLLPPALLDASPRVATTAARALERAGASSEMTEPAWQSDQVWSRKAAWRLQRSGGGWDRVHADLRASNDADPRFSATGRTSLGNWLVHGAATAWHQPTAEQKVLFQRMLPASGLGRDARRFVTFHAGLVPEPEPAAPQPSQPPVGLPAPAAEDQPRSLTLRDRFSRAWRTRR